MPRPAARSGRAVGFLLVTLSAACFGAMPLFGRGAYAAGADPTTLRAVALLGETLAPLQLAGGACILAAVVRLARSNQISAVPQQVRDPQVV